MTKHQANEYARGCAYSKARGTPKPPRPDNGTLSDAIRKLANAQSRQTTSIKTVRHELSIAVDNMDKIIDLLYLLKETTPEIQGYCNLADFIQNAIIETETILKTL